MTPHFHQSKWLVCLSTWLWTISPVDATRFYFHHSLFGDMLARWWEYLFLLLHNVEWYFSHKNECRAGILQQPGMVYVSVIYVSTNIDTRPICILVQPICILVENQPICILDSVLSTNMHIGENQYSYWLTWHPVCLLDLIQHNQYAYWSLILSKLAQLCYLKLFYTFWRQSIHGASKTIQQQHQFTSSAAIITAIPRIPTPLFLPHSSHCNARSSAAIGLGMEIRPMYTHKQVFPAHPRANVQALGGSGLTVQPVCPRDGTDHDHSYSTGIGPKHHDQG